VSASTSAKSRRRLGLLPQARSVPSSRTHSPERNANTHTKNGPMRGLPMGRWTGATMAARANISVRSQGATAAVLSPKGSKWRTVHSPMPPSRQDHAAIIRRSRNVIASPAAGQTTRVPQASQSADGSPSIALYASQLSCPSHPDTTAAKQADNPSPPGARLDTARTMVLTHSRPSPLTRASRATTQAIPARRRSGRTTPCARAAPRHQRATNSAASQPTSAVWACQTNAAVGISASCTR